MMLICTSSLTSRQDFGSPLLISMIFPRSCALLAIPRPRLCRTAVTCSMIVVQLASELIDLVKSEGANHVQTELSPAAA